MSHCERLRTALRSTIACRSTALYDLEVDVDPAFLSEPIERALSRGWYEREEVELINHCLRPGDRVVELGAGLGVTTMVAARVVGPDAVRAFEANPALIAPLNANLKHNGLDVVVENAVLLPRSGSRGHGEVRLNLGDQFWAASVLEDGRQASTDSRTVPTAWLEDVLVAHRANALIMDIEGLEVEIMESADLSSIDKLIVEIHYARTGAERTNAAIFGLVAQGFGIDFQRSARGALLLTR